MTTIAIIVCVVVLVFVLRLADRIDRLEITVKRLTAGNVAPELHQQVTPQQVSATVPAPVVVAPVTPAEHTKREFKLGSRSFTGLGIVALLLGVGFFFRYAVENGLISEPMRIAMGILFGLILIGIGFWLKNTYRTYGVSLIGTGLGVIYLTWYAAYALYTLIPAELGFALLAATALIGIVLALVLNARQLAAAALLGGYAGVVVFSSSLTILSAFIALFVLAALAAVLTVRKEWSEVLAIALIATTLSLLGFISSTTVAVGTALPLITVLYILFVGATLWSQPREDAPYVYIYRFSLYATPIAYLFVCARMLTTNQAIAVAAFGVALFYAVIAVVARTIGKGHTALRAFVPVTDLFVPAFLALGIALYFKGNAPIMLIAVEGALAVAIGLAARSRLQYIAGQILLTFSGIWVLVFLLSESLFTFASNVSFIFDERTTTLGIVGIAFAVSWLLHMRFPAVLQEAEYADARAFDSLAAYAAFVATALIESSRIAGASADHTMYSVIGISCVAAGMFALGVWAREVSVRWATYIVFVGLAGIVSLTSLFGQHTVFLMNMYVVALAAVLILAGVIHLLAGRSLDIPVAETKARKQIIATLGNLVTLTVITMEISSFFRLNASVLSHGYASRVSISIFWLIYALAATSFGIARNSSLVRQLGLGLLVLTGLKICLYDAQELSDLYRFASFFALGVILLIVGFIYYRFRDKMDSLVGRSIDEV